MKKAEYVYVVKYHSGDLNKTFVYDVLSSKKKAEALIKEAYPNSIYDEDEGIWKLSGEKDWVYFERFEVK